MLAMACGMRLGYTGVGQQRLQLTHHPHCSPKQLQLRVPAAVPDWHICRAQWGQSLLAELGTVASEAEGEVNRVCPCKASPAGWVAPGQEPSLLSVTRHHLPVPSLPGDSPAGGL